MREPGSRYIDFLVPGLLGMNLMGSAIWGMGFAIVDARRKKLMKRLMATPMPRHYYLLSFLLSRLVLLVVEVGVVLGFGVLVFQVPVRGSLLELVAALRAGLAVLQRSRTADRVARPDHRSGVRADEPGDDADVDRSGVFFSAQRFPAVMQPLIKALPLTASIDALRANMLQGAGLASHCAGAGHSRGVAGRLLRARH